MNETSSIYSYTVINSTTEAFKDQTPYLVAIVTRADGSRVAARVEGYTPDKQIHIGETVERAGTDASGNEFFRLRS
jgi:uncharacterized OB-fold protein